MVTRLGLLPSAGAQNSGYPDHVAGEGPLRVGRGNAQLGMKHGDPEAAADRQRLVFRRFDQEDFLHLRQFFRHLGGEIVGLAPILVEVVKLPDVLVRRPFPDARRQPRNPWKPRPKAQAIQPS